MARTDTRGGPQTRAHISQVATSLILERGYDGVTVAEIARQAGVSSVTVFNHFPRKEDLFLDRASDAHQLIRSAIRERGPGADVVSALHEVSLRLFDEHHPLSGVHDRSIPFFRAIAGSPALISRARGIAAELQSTLADELDRDATFEGDGALLAAFFVAGYAEIMVDTARRLIAGGPRRSLMKAHRARIEGMFGTLRRGFPSASR